MVENVQKLKICYFSDSPIRLKNSRAILERMEAENITEMNRKGFVTENAEYRFIDCRNHKEYMGLYADQAIIDYREPMITIAKMVTAKSCVPENEKVIDDRNIGTADSTLFKDYSRGSVVL